MIFLQNAKLNPYERLGQHELAWLEQTFGIRPGQGSPLGHFVGVVFQDHEAPRFLFANPLGVRYLSKGEVIACLEADAPAPERPAPARRVWDFREVDDLSGCEGFFVTADRRLSDEEIRRVAGCIGYALREHLAGEDLGEPRVFARHSGGMTLCFDYDFSKSRRDDPDYHEALEAALRYASEGTPVRRTNRAGPGTKGTRLVEGVPHVTLGIEVVA